MAPVQTKDVVVIAGPNGAGKTTWAYRRLPQTLGFQVFVNADEIARGISPLDPEASALAAGRLMIQRLNELVAAGESSPLRRLFRGADMFACWNDVVRRAIERSPCFYGCQPSILPSLVSLGA